MLKAFLDESYSKERTLIAGFVGTADQWTPVRKRWIDELKRRGAPYYHGSELKARKRAFAKWEREERDGLANACAVILSASELGEISAGFVGDWANVLREAPALAKRFPTAYAFTFELVVAQIQRAALKWYKGETVECVLDEQDQHSRRAIEVWQANRTRGLWANVASVTYADDRDVVELQCADMLAHEYFQYPKLGAQNLPLGSRLHERTKSLFAGRKQWEETLLSAFDVIRSWWTSFIPKKRRHRPPRSTMLSWQSTGSSTIRPTRAGVVTHASQIHALSASAQTSSAARTGWTSFH